MATFFEKKFLYSPCSNFVAVVNLAMKMFHNLRNLGMTKSRNIVSIRPFTEIESFVILFFKVILSFSQIYR